ncbi:hypothetical protein GUJ93_ZPchr0005g15732 [Zizania palustris]|uniref:Uncharacterized protein n=1 Tax=Zizania palustris TaxID=103762 RepID=A0A8J5SHM5_ZIZPA|nr:hypothetical protein GUJ93_ZPchr0005g15732 [Zizania palustris]
MCESVVLTLAGAASNNVGKVLQKKGTHILPPLSFKLKVIRAYAKNNSAINSPGTGQVRERGAAHCCGQEHGWSFRDGGAREALRGRGEGGASGGASEAVRASAQGPGRQRRHGRGVGAGDGAKLTGQR